MLEKTFDILLGWLTPRERLAVGMALLVGLMILHLLAACGYIPRVSGFAYASDVDALREEIKGDEKRLRDVALAMPWTKRCV